MLTFIISIFLIACQNWGQKFESGHYSSIDTGSDPLTFSFIWIKEGLRFGVYNGSGSYNLGMACTDPADSDPWTGEDCLNGYAVSDGTNILYCHPLYYESSFFASGGNPLTLNQATETVFTESDSVFITYAVWDENSTCWTFGYDTSYYTGAGCQDIN